MTFQPEQICFGLTSELDKQSFSCFLQLAGRRELADVLASRLSSAEIESFVDSFMVLLRRHLSEDEYHLLFLRDESPHHHTSRSSKEI
jgi:hypothetical protein